MNFIIDGTLKSYILFCYSYINLLFQTMHSFKSSPLLSNNLAPRFTKNARRSSKRRVSKEQQVLIPNPFRQMQQENYLPFDLKLQVEQLDFISPTQVQSITFNNTQGGRRSSTFARHLQAMQNAAKKQEQMYQCFMGVKQQPKQISIATEMEQQSPITIEQNDDVSMRMEHCFFRIDDDPTQNEQLNFFNQQMDEEDVIFYSQNFIGEGQVQIKDDFEAYFDV